MRPGCRDTSNTVTLSFGDVSTKLLLGLKDNRTVGTVNRVSGAPADPPVRGPPAPAPDTHDVETLQFHLRAGDSMIERPSAGAHSARMPNTPRIVVLMRVSRCWRMTSRLHAPLAGTAATCFQLQGHGGAWSNATATLLSDGKRIRVGPVAAVAQPTGVRYAWLDNALACNVYNSGNLPMFPFAQPLP